MQLQVIDQSRLFDKIYVVVTNRIPARYMNLRTPYEVIRVDSNSAESWRGIYENHTFDILYCTFEPPASLPKHNVPVLFVLHDPGRYIYPEMMEPNVIDAHMADFNNIIARENSYIITVSKSSRKDILELFPVFKRSIFVLNNYVSDSFVETIESPQSPFGHLVAGKFFLTIGRYIPTKNTLSVVKAFERRAKVFDDYFLVIVGRKGWYRDFDDYVEANSGENVALLDFVEDSVLQWLYRNSYGLINASIYEGFGLPLIEACACGCQRVFCSDIPVFKEILNEATLFFDPHDIQDIQKKVFASYIERRLDNGETVLSRFNLKNSIAQFCEIVRTALDQYGYNDSGSVQAPLLS